MATDTRTCRLFRPFSNARTNRSPNFALHPARSVRCSSCFYGCPRRHTHRCLSRRFCFRNCYISYRFRRRYRLHGYFRRFRCCRGRCRFLPLCGHRCTHHQVQLVSGASPLAYWVSAYLWDVALFFVLTVLVMLTFAAYGRDASKVIHK